MRNLSVLDNLIYINRYSGNRTIIKESVGDHVICMNSLAFEWIPKLNEKLPSDKKISLENVIYRIAVHDLDEVISGDINNRFKYANKDLKDKLQSTVNELAEKQLGIELSARIRNAKMFDTPEGFLVKVIDVVQAGHKMESEIHLGNTYFLTEISNVIETLMGLRESLQEVMWEPIEPIRDFISEYIEYFKEIQNEHK